MRGDPRALLLLAALLVAGAGYRSDDGLYEDATPPRGFSATSGVLWHTPLAGASNAQPVAFGNLVCTLVEPVTVSCHDAATGTRRWSSENRVVDTLPEARRTELLQRLSEVDALSAQRPGLIAEQGQLRRQMRASDDPAIPRRLEEIGARLQVIAQLQTAYADYLTPPDREFVGYAMPTPVADTTALYVATGNGVVSRHDATGKRLWTVWLGAASADFRGWYFAGPTSTASPQLVDGVLVVGHGALFGLDPATGATRWKVDRYRDFGTPAVARVGGVSMLVCPDGRVVRVQDGRVLAEGAGDVWFVGPTVVGDRVFWAGGEALEGTTVNRLGAHAVRLVPSGGGVTVQPLWTAPLPQGHRVFSVPVVHAGSLWVLQENGRLTRLDVGNGAVVATYSLAGLTGGGFYVPLVVAGGSVWTGRERGSLYEVDELGRVTEHTLEGQRAAPTFVGSRVYVRTLAGLWAFGR